MNNIQIYTIGFTKKTAEVFFETFGDASSALNMPKSYKTQAGQHASL